MIKRIKTHKLLKRNAFFNKQTKFVSRFDLVVKSQAGKQKDLGSNLLWLSFLFKSCGLWTLSCDFVPHIYETLKMALIAAHSNAGVILVVTV